MSKHTEGPWMMDKGHMIIGGNGMRVAYADLMSDGDEALVIAAPDLFEALEMVIADMAPTYHDCTDDGLQECAWCIGRKAIARAKGEPQ
jgi:hypothetical protein